MQPTVHLHDPETTVQVVIEIVTKGSYNLLFFFKMAARNLDFYMSSLDLYSLASDLCNTNTYTLGKTKTQILWLKQNLT